MVFNKVSRSVIDSMCVWWLEVAVVTLIILILAVLTWCWAAGSFHQQLVIKMAAFAQAVFLLSGEFLMSTYTEEKFANRSAAFQTLKIKMS